MFSLDIHFGDAFDEHICWEFGNTHCHIECYGPCNHLPSCTWCVCTMILLLHGFTHTNFT